jgi:hypothetical protein
MKFVAIATMLAAAAACSTALAGQASASITNFSLTLESFGAAPTPFIESAETVVMTQLDGAPLNRQQADGFLLPLEIAVDPSASASVSGGPAIAVHASAIGPDFTNAYAYAGSIGDLVIPAFTTATFSADFSVSATGSSDQEAFDICIVGCSHRDFTGPAAGDFSLTSTYVNDSGSDYVALIYVETTAFAQSIPEPGERLMTLAGLALMCASAARRRAGLVPRFER